MNLEHSIVQWAGIYMQPQLCRQVLSASVLHSPLFPLTDTQLVRLQFPDYYSKPYCLGSLLSYLGGPVTVLELLDRTLHGVPIQPKGQQLATCVLLNLKWGQWDLGTDFYILPECNYSRYKYSWVDSTVLACVRSVSPWLSESLYDMHALA